ncbi:MAG: MgtC/SapB family protein [Clostridia bacterium]|nr:MgtC/SapB family protein [Spirochaetia bacterium]
MEQVFIWLGGPVLDVPAACARLFVSLFACGLIGLEREMRRQAAGWRTHIIIGLGATLLMMLSIWLPQTISGDKGDPGRIAAQVVSGIGFLGAGAFIKVGNNVKGMTTAATIWFVAGIGLAIGAGMWQVGLIVLALGLIVLTILEPLEKLWFPGERLKLLQIWYEGSSLDRTAVYSTLRLFGIGIQTVDASLAVRKKQTRLSALVKVPLDCDLDALFTELRRTGKVEKVRLHENY